MAHASMYMHSTFNYTKVKKLLDDCLANWWQGTNQQKLSKICYGHDTSRKVPISRSHRMQGFPQGEKPSVEWAISYTAIPLSCCHNNSTPFDISATSFEEKEAMATRIDSVTLLKAER